VHVQALNTWAPVVRFDVEIMELVQSPVQQRTLSSANTSLFEEGSAFKCGGLVPSSSSFPSSSSKTLRYHNLWIGRSYMIRARSVTAVGPGEMSRSALNTLAHVC